MTNYKLGLWAVCLLLGAFIATPAMAQQSPPTPADSPCDPEYWDSLKARAWLEAQREITQNQNLIFKPDSVLEYTCFNRYLNELADHADELFSENPRWASGSGLGALGSITDALGVDISAFSSVEDFLGSDFSDVFPGGLPDLNIDDLMGDIANPTLDDLINTIGGDLTIDALIDGGLDSIDFSDLFPDPGNLSVSGIISGAAGQINAQAFLDALPSGTTFDYDNFFDNYDREVLAWEVFARFPNDMPVSALGLSASAEALDYLPRGVSPDEITTGEFFTILRSSLGDGFMQAPASDFGLDDINISPESLVPAGTDLANMDLASFLSTAGLSNTFSLDGLGLDDLNFDLTDFLPPGADPSSFSINDIFGGLAGSLPISLDSLGLDDLNLDLSSLGIDLNGTVADVLAQLPFDIPGLSDLGSAFGGASGGGSGAPTNMEAALNLLIGSPNIEWINTNFGHDLLGGRLQGFDYQPAPVQKAIPYECDIMNRVWEQAKCMDFIDTPQEDGFFTFEDYQADPDKRFLPMRCQPPSGPGLTWEENIGIAYVSDEGEAFNTPWTEDNVETFFDHLDPDNCGSYPPIATGLKVNAYGQEYDEHVCLMPGCHYNITNGQCSLN